MLCCVIAGGAHPRLRQGQTAQLSDWVWQVLPQQTAAQAGELLWCSWQQMQRDDRAHVTKAQPGAADR